MIGSYHVCKTQKKGFFNCLQRLYNSQLSKTNVILASQRQFFFIVERVAMGKYREKRICGAK